MSAATLSRRQQQVLTHRCAVWRNVESVDPVTKESTPAWTPIAWDVPVRYLYTQNDSDPAGIARIKRRTALTEDQLHALVDCPIRDQDVILDLTTGDPFRGVNEGTYHRVQGQPRILANAGRRSIAHRVYQLMEEEQPHSDITSLLLYDDFNRSQLYLGSALTGQRWAPRAGTWHCDGSYAVPSGTNPTVDSHGNPVSGFWATADVGVADYTVERTIRFTANASGLNPAAGIILRFNPANRTHYVTSFQAAFGTFLLAEWTGSTYVVRASTAITAPVAGTSYTTRVAVSGTTFTISLGGVVIMTYSSATTNPTLTHVGMRAFMGSGGGIPEADLFRVWR